MNLFVVRHGQTYENIDKVMQGNMDTLLDDEGRKQAISLRNTIKESNIDLIISSPLKRAYETATLLTNDIKIITDNRLKSRNHGEFQGSKRTDININDYWNIKKNIKYKEAESVMDLYNRIDSLLNDIKTNYNDKNILLVTHSGICRILYYYFNGIPEDGDLSKYESNNCSFEKYELN